jgi:hypothetical protein
MWRSAWSRAIAAIAVLCTLGSSGVFAQSTASISGVVKDAEGSVLPGVSVTVRNDVSGVAQEVLTDGTGRYQITALQAGSYTVSASLTGFKTAAAKSVRVSLGQPMTIPLTLEIGSLEETVNVFSSSELSTPKRQRLRRP